jgi:hypothetical protein
LAYKESLKRTEDFFRTDNYQKRLARRKGFSGVTEYYDSIAKKLGYSGVVEYNRARLKLKGIHSESEHQAKLARALGLESANDYQQLKRLERSMRPRNIKFCTWLNRCLDKLGKNPKWLAGQMGVSLQACYTYLEGYSIPREHHFLKLRYVLAQAALPGLILPEPPELKKAKH